MAKNISLPSLTSEAYELYKEESLALRVVTDLSKDRQGVVITLTLPDDDKNKIVEKVSSQIGREELNKENDLDTLMIFLDRQIIKDDLSDSLEKK